MRVYYNLHSHRNSTMPELKLAQLRKVARRYNSTLKKPIAVSQRKAPLKAQLKQRKVSLESKSKQLKNLVSKPNQKALKFAKAKQAAERKKSKGTGRHLDSVIDKLESKHGKRKKKNKSPSGFGAGTGADATNVQHLVKKKHQGA